jgi:hypothetical protein
MVLCHLYLWVLVEERLKKLLFSKKDVVLFFQNALFLFRDIPCIKKSPFLSLHIHRFHFFYVSLPPKSISLKNRKITSGN